MAFEHWTTVRILELFVVHSAILIYCARDVGNAVESSDDRFPQLKPLALGWISIHVPAVQIPYDLLRFLVMNELNDLPWVFNHGLWAVLVISICNPFCYCLSNALFNQFTVSENNLEMMKLIIWCYFIKLENIITSFSMSKSTKASWINLKKIFFIERRFKENNYLSIGLFGVWYCSGEPMVSPRQEHPRMSKTAKMSVFILADGRDQVEASNQPQNNFGWLDKKKLGALFRSWGVAVDRSQKGTK